MPTPVSSASPDRRAPVPARLQAELRRAEQLLDLASVRWRPGREPGDPTGPVQSHQPGTLLHCAPRQHPASAGLRALIPASAGLLIVTDPRPRTLAGLELEFLEQLGRTVSGLAELHAQRRACAHETRLRRRLERAARSGAQHDPLTGLPTRTHLLDILNRTLARMREGRRVALLHLGLDQFRLINDRHGFKAGDAVLSGAARLLSEAVRGGDTVARTGNDEFVVLLPEQDDASGAERVARALRDRLATYRRAGLDDEGLRASIGIALAGPEHSAETLLQRAAAALAQAKRRGGGVAEFDAEEARRAHARIDTVRELRHAIERNQLCLHYQPQIELASGKLVGVEALVRWQHPTRGLLGPGEFLPLAEEHGLVEPLGRWVLDHALGQLAAWDAAGHAPITLAVNASPRELSADWSRGVAAALLRHRFAAHRLEIEITESCLIDRPDAATGWLRELRDLGVGIALDDFGVGYSSLALLRNLPITRLKLDRSFIGDLANPVGLGFVEAFAALARALGVPTVAEGIETRAQHSRLKSLSHYAQGFLYSRPLSADDLMHWAARWPARLPLAA